MRIPLRIRKVWMGTLLLFLLVACSSQEANRTPPTREMSFAIQARQYVWEVTHPGADGTLGTSDDQKLENQLVLPEGTRVHLKLQSADVIHGFWVPQKRTRQVLMPGQVYELDLDFFETGKYRLACSELCGTGHGRMIGWVVVLTDQKYKEWLTRSKD